MAHLRLTERIWLRCFAPPPKSFATLGTSDTPSRYMKFRTPHLKKGNLYNVMKPTPKVVPEIINSRTMLPLRFVVENLGCTVQWDGTTKTITITYQQ